MNEQLQCQLSDACKFYGMINRYNSAIEEMDNQCNNLHFQCSEYIEKHRFSAKKGITLIIVGNALLPYFLIAVGFCVMCLPFLFVMPVMNSDYEVNSAVGIILLVVAYLGSAIAILGGIYQAFPIGIPIGIILYKRKYCNKKDQELLAVSEAYCQENFYPAIQECEQNIQNLTNERNKFVNANKHILQFLPQEYQNASAVVYMEQAVRNCRADSLKEVINLYEDQLHKWKIEQQNQEILDQQALQNYLLEEQRDAMDRMRREQRSTNTALAGIEALQFYNTFCR